ncbi:MAG TPA: heme exporter protein CcmD [Paracoccaceae bacterium]|nr:heme exporter protein CcmD [Paracoccaceae bacterium]
MPDLGKYAAAVLSAYGMTVLLLLGLVAVTWLRGRRVRRKLDEIEARKTKHGA